MITPLSNITFDCNSNNEYFDTLQILENYLIPFVLEKKLINIYVRLQVVIKNNFIN